ncbi:MAG: hypothetical protein KDB21_17320 [Acidimicrobiales bacterium]|nr:hypothetical protein [Acidimicrobiales bacterium]
MSDPLTDELDATGVAYDIVECDPALADTAEFCAHYGYAMQDSANAIVVVGKSEPRTYALCVVLATTRLDVNGVARKRLGSRKASFASPEETAELTGMAIGGVTPVGLAGRLPIWIDSRVMERERVIVGGGSRDRKFFVPPSGLAALAGAEIVDNLAKEPT